MLNKETAISVTISFLNRILSSSKKPITLYLFFVFINRILKLKH